MTGPMSCERLRRASVEDDPPLAAMRAHAAVCDDCAGFLRSQTMLESAVADWRERTPAAPPSLRAALLERSAAAVEARQAAESRPAAEVHSFPTVRRALAALAVAATLLIALLAGLGAPDLLRTEVVSMRGGLLVDDALARARAVEREHAEAIARLAESAEPILAAAEDPATPPAEAARLRALSDRLASLDEAIRDVRHFLNTNPGHPSARTMLLAAYMDKTDLLAEILGERSLEDI